MLQIDSAGGDNDANFVGKRPFKGGQQVCQTLADARSRFKNADCAVVKTMRYCTGKVELRRTFFIVIKKRSKAAGFLKIACYFIGIQAVVYSFFRFIFVVHGNLIAQPFYRCGIVFNADDGCFVVLNFRINLCSRQDFFIGRYQKSPLGGIGLLHCLTGNFIG